MSDSADAIAIAVVQLRNHLDATGDMIDRAVRDAYARGYSDGLTRARSEEAPIVVLDREPVEIDDVAHRRPTTV